jgi:hypothetical protein
MAVVSHDSVRVYAGYNANVTVSAMYEGVAAIYRTWDSLQNRRHIDV